MHDYGTTAAVALVIDHGRVVSTRTWGEAAPGRATTRDSVFGVASLSKLVAAWGIMTLVHHGKVNLDAPVSTYLTPAQRAALPFDTHNHDAAPVAEPYIRAQLAIARAIIGPAARCLRCLMNSAFVRRRARQISGSPPRPGQPGPILAPDTA